jgi:hypothetical protein
MIYSFVITQDDRLSMNDTLKAVVSNANNFAAREINAFVIFIIAYNNSQFLISHL